MSLSFATPDGDGKSRLVRYDARRELRHGLLVAAVGASAILAASIGFAQVENPIPEPITNRGLRVEVSEVARLPDSRTKHSPERDVDPNAWARVSFVRDLPDGRRFANDSRGGLYLIGADDEPSLYVDVSESFPHGVYAGLGSGFIGYRGTVPELQGKFVFGDIQRGRVFAVGVAEMKAADDGIPETVAAIEEIQLYVRNADGGTRDVTLWELVEGTMGRTVTRADLQVSEGRDGRSSSHRGRTASSECSAPLTEETAVCQSTWQP